MDRKDGYLARNSPIIKKTRFFSSTSHIVDCRQFFCGPSERWSVDRVACPAALHHFYKRAVLCRHRFGDGWPQTGLQCTVDPVERANSVFAVSNVLLPRRLACRQFPHDNAKAVHIHSRAVVLIPSKHLGPQISKIKSQKTTFTPLQLHGGKRTGACNQYSGTTRN